MRFYLNNLNNRVYVEVAPQITDTFDESLDSATVTLKANNISTPYAPNQYFYICDDNDNILYRMVLALDMVSIYSTNPLKYLHRLSLVQNIRNTTKNLVRNSVFTQPMENIKKGYFAIVNYLIKFGSTDFSWTDNNNVWIEPININEQDVPYGDFTLKAEIVGVKKDGNQPAIFYGSFSDIITNPSSTIRIKLYNGETYTNVYYDISNSDLNKEIVAKDIYDYIKANPIGNYSLRVDSPFVNTEWTNSTITENVPTQFTFKISYKINIYYYNCYDLLDLLIKRQQHKNLIYEKKPLFKLPSSGELYDLLNNTIPPNFAFTTNSMFECIADIFRLFDAIFTLGEDNELGIEYFNEYKDESNNRPTSYRITHAEEQYNRGLINFYQDARVMERFPSSKGYAPARSSGLGVPTSTNDFCILLPHNIEYIDKVEMLNPNVKMSFYYYVNGGTLSGLTDATPKYIDDIVIDLGNFIFESSLWALLPTNLLTARTNNQEKYQQNTLYYEKGTNKIQLGLTYQAGAIQTIAYNFESVLLYSLYRFFGKFNKDDDTNLYEINSDYYETNFLSIKVAVTYMATIDGSLKVESINDKYNGEMFVDQANGAVDLNKLGSNMFGLSLKLGEPMLTKTFEITNFANRIRKGQYIKVNGERWIANVITHTILNNGKTQSTVNFVKDYNSISLYTKLNQQKRMSTISSNLISKSEILFGEYLYFSTEYVDIANKTQMKVDAISSLFSRSFSNEESIKRVDYATIDGLNGEYLPYQFNDRGTTKNTENIAIPLITYGAGNSLCFEASFSHPKSAGNQTVSEYDWWHGTSYFTNFIPYTNENGFMDACNLKVYYKVNESNMDNFPIVDTSSDQLIISLEDLIVKKYSNEIFAINYQITLLPYEKSTDFVGKEFIDKNALVNVNENKKSFYIYYSTSEEYDVLDLKGLGNRKAITSVTKNTQDNYFALTFNFESISDTVKSWAICDEEGDIYFAFNKALNTSTSTTIYFYPRNQRINDDNLIYKYSVQVYIDEGVESINLQLARNGSVYYNQILTSYLHKECNENDTYSWSATAKLGYYLNVPGASGTVDGAEVIRPQAIPIDYTLQGTSQNGTVKFYLTTTHIAEITNAPYKTKVYWVIEPDSGYHAPSPSEGSLNVNENDFTLSGTTASKTFDSCIPNDYNVTFNLSAGTYRVYFKVDDGIWRYRETSDTIAIPYNSEVEWYAVPKQGNKIASGTPTSNNHAFFNVPIGGITKTTYTNLINYTLNGSSQNGTVHFYLTSAHLEEIYTSPYGTTVYYVIEPNTGYNPPSPSSGSLNVDANNFYLDDNTEIAGKTFPPCTIKTFTMSISKGTGITSLVYSTNNGASWNTIYTSLSLTLPYGTQFYWYANVQSGYTPSSGTPSSQSNAEYLFINQSYSRSASATLNQLASVSCSGRGSKNASVYVAATTQYAITVTQVRVYYGLLNRVIYSGSTTIGGYGGQTFNGTTTINLADGDYAEVTYTYNSNTYTAYGYF